MTMAMAAHHVKSKNEGNKKAPRSSGHINFYWYSLAIAIANSHSFSISNQSLPLPDISWDQRKRMRLQR
jgi:hypothetical protein